MKIKTVDLFCDIGGLTYGLQKTGIPVVAGIDIYQCCEYAYTHNNDCQFIKKSIEEVTGKEIKELLKGTEIKKLSVMPHDRIGAIYFSIFYMKSNLELYRHCKNSTCDKYFLVKATTTRNKYCNSEHCNRTSQSRYKKRKNNRINSRINSKKDFRHRINPLRGIGLYLTFSCAATPLFEVSTSSITCDNAFMLF